MPMTRVALRKGKSKEYKAAILDQIYEAMRETVHIKDGDRFMSLTEHEASEFAYGGDFLDIARTDDLVQIQIFWSPGKTAQMKQAMYKAIVDSWPRRRGSGRKTYSSASSRLLPRTGRSATARPNSTTPPRRGRPWRGCGERPAWPDCRRPPCCTTAARGPAFDRRTARCRRGLRRP